MTSLPPSSPPAPRASRPAVKRRGRTPGRPLGEGVDLRAGLLDATVACFARHGIAGSSLRQIATEAGVTPALLHYYFGGKEALLEAVIEERLMPVMQGLRGPLLQAGDDPGALIRGFVRTVLATALAHPWLPQALSDIIDRSYELWMDKRAKYADTTPWLLDDLRRTVVDLPANWNANGFAANEKMNNCMSGGTMISMRETLLHSRTSSSLRTMVAMRRRFRRGSVILAITRPAF